MDSPTKDKAQGYVVIHGHFYQPPRENPWIEQVEVEAGAHPYHDWNARIAAECYTPNASARIYDGQGRILNIINNYEKISFNFGPTLLAWLEAHAPLTYERLLRADRLSLARWGHGNALAQAYNHVILPLASPRDRETEVIWGLKDFEHRFGRKAEAMWLPETAVNYPTLATLADHGLKYVILSPYQARRVRPLSGGAWEVVEAHTLDTTQAYRCVIPEGSASSSRSMDIFFYNGAVAAEVSFGDLLKDSHRLAARLGEAFRPQVNRPQLLHVATDGENYGHHHKFGELALAHALAEAFPQRGFLLTNYGAFLELSPPRMRVELHLGAKDEGSSWSCAHGVGRWQEDCGCATGGPPHWQQKWRAPLREAVDYLNERLARIFETEGSRWLRDPWAARNDYIEVILDRREEVVEQFFARHGVPGLSRGDWPQPLRLLEMQRHALLMYTSCGWFFADISGLESLKVMEYAARALQLGQYFTREPLEEPFLQYLERAPSNLPEEGDGRRIFLKRVKPQVVDFPKVVNQWAISWLKDRERQCPTRVYHFRVDPLEAEVHSQGSLTLAAGRLQVTSGITWRTETMIFFTAHLGSYLYRTQVRSNSSLEEFFQLKQELFRVLQETPENLIPHLARHLGERYYTVKDIFRDEKERIFHDLLAPNLEDSVRQIIHQFEEVAPTLRAMAAEHLPLPRLYRALGEITLNRRLVEIMRQVAEHPELLPASEDLQALVQEAALFNFQLESGEGAQILRQMLHHQLMDLATTFNLSSAAALRDFLELALNIPITLDLHEAQNFFFTLMQEHFPPLAARSARDREARELAQVLIRVAEALNFNPNRYLQLLA
jgi:alpha-amylase/alpha-mannosidase (GH57 family)